MSSRRIVEVALGVLLAVALLAAFRSCSTPPRREVIVDAGASRVAGGTDPTAPTSSSTSSTSTSTTVDGPAPAVDAPPAPAPQPRASRSAHRASGLSSTAYCLTGHMANGRPARVGAVASNDYPLGTRLRVSPSPVGELVTVEDRIGHGSDLDFALPGDCAGARAWGRRRVVVLEVIGKDG